MSDSDIKIMIYEIYTRIQEGESFEDIISHFEYFDPLFCEMYNMYLRSPDEIGNMQGYIDLTYTKIQMVLARFLKYFVPCVYGFVALFVISVYFSIIMPMMNIVGDI
jgi:type II secretory pathway component PulF